MGNRLSHSSVSKFQDCGRAWFLHYKMGYRSETQSAALLFGTAIDKAVESLVTNKNLDEARQIFKGLWEKQEINGVLTELKYSIIVVYANSDLDLDLLPEDYEDLDEVLEIKDKKDSVGFDNLNAMEKQVFNEACWEIAKTRGLLMLEAVNNEVLPKITKVHSTQEKIELNNGNGDTVIGFADMVAEYGDYPEPIVFDFKTSAREYEPDSVRTSPQLTLYVHALSEKYNTRKAGFIVLSKQIQKNRKKVCSVCGNDGTGSRHKTCAAETNEKRCNGAWNETINPKAKVQVLIDEIPEQLENIVMENVDDINKAITNGIFIRNLGSCEKPWGKCSFYDLCHKNSDKGLVKKEEK